MKPLNIPFVVAAVMASMFLITLPLLSQETFWTRVDSSSVADIAFHPNGSIFGALDNIWGRPQGIVRSTDEGNTWEQVFASSVFKLAISRQGEVYAADYDTVYRSTDNGATWNVLVTPFLGGNTYIRCIRLDSLDRIYLGVGNLARIYLSDDHGASWGLYPVRPNRNGAVEDILFANGAIYVATDNEFLRSTTMMSRWSLKKLPHARRPYWLASLCQNRAGDIVAASRFNRLWIYEKTRPLTRIRSWKYRDVPTPVSGIDAFTIDQQNSIYWGRDGIYRSTDNGISWNALNSGTSGTALSITALATSPDGYIYMSNFDGIYHSTEPVLFTGTMEALEQPTEDLPAVYSLAQNYPNPFNPQTTIEFDLAEDALVTLKVYNTLGQLVSTLMEHEFREAGTTDSDFEATALPTGVYYYRLVAEPTASQKATGSTFVDMKKMILVR